MAQYRKKPVMIEAFCLGIDPMPDWFMDKVSSHEIILHGSSTQLECCAIPTREGVMRATRGDYILQGVQHEVYPCKADIFLQTYEAV